MLLRYNWWWYWPMETLNPMLQATLRAEEVAEEAESEVKKEGEGDEQYYWDSDPTDDTGIWDGGSMSSATRHVKATAPV